MYSSRVIRFLDYQTFKSLGFLSLNQVLNESPLQLLANFLYISPL